MFKKKSDIDTLLTIGIPTYNRFDFLKRSLLSVLGQSESKYSLIILDNASSENCPQEIRDLLCEFSDVIYYRNRHNLGMTENWTNIYRLAETPFISMLHDDDTIEEDYVSKVLGALEKNPDADMLSVRLHLMKNDSPVVSRYKSLRMFLDTCLRDSSRVKEKDYLFGFNTYVVGSCIRRDTLLRLDGFSEESWPAIDYDFVLRLSKSGGKILHIKSRLYYYFIGQNESMKSDTALKMLLYDFQAWNIMIESRSSISRPFLRYLNRVMFTRRFTNSNIYNWDLSDEIDNYDHILVKKSSFLFFIGILYFKSLQVRRAFIF